VNEFLPRPFVEKERRRVFVPDETFPRRVMARIQPVGQSAAAVWDLVPGFARPMIAVMTVILVVILGIQIVYTKPPSAGIVNAYLAAEETAVDQWLYHDAEPADEDLLLEISLVGDSQ
jgi:hypothetical protein